MKNTCSEVMIRTPVTLKPEATLLEALDTIHGIGVRYLPVVDVNNDFIGIFSSLTLLTTLLPSSISINMGKRMVDLGFMKTNIKELREELVARKDEGIIDHIIKNDITTVNPDSSIMEAIHLLHEKKAHVIVLEPDSRQFVGIVTINSLLDQIKPQL